MANNPKTLRKSKIVILQNDYPYEEWTFKTTKKAVKFFKTKMDDKEVLLVRYYRNTKKPFIEIMY